MTRYHPPTKTYIHGTQVEKSSPWNTGTPCDIALTLTLETHSTEDLINTQIDSTMSELRHRHRKFIIYVRGSDEVIGKHFTVKYYLGPSPIHDPRYPIESVILQYYTEPPSTQSEVVEFRSCPPPKDPNGLSDTSDRKLLELIYAQVRSIQDRLDALSPDTKSSETLSD